VSVLTALISDCA